MPLIRRLARLFAAPAQNPAIVALYGACVAQARALAFYSKLAVPDTIDGRFDLLLLHVFLVMRRLGPHSEAKQQLFDLMFADMDKNLREMGVGDMSIGKRIKPMIAAFYGRAQAYEKALAADDAALADALARNVYGKVTAPPAALRDMAAYVRRQAAKLDTQPLAEMLEGQVAFAAVVV